MFCLSVSRKQLEIPFSRLPSNTISFRLFLLFALSTALPGNLAIYQSSLPLSCLHFIFFISAIQCTLLAYISKMQYWKGEGASQKINRGKQTRILSENKINLEKPICYSPPSTDNKSQALSYCMQVILYCTFLATVHINGISQNYFIWLNLFKTTNNNS